MNNIDLGKTKITDKIRVSSAAIWYEWYNYYQLETWIFSEDKDVQKSRQIIHCTTGSEIPQMSIDKAKKIHQQISYNLIKKIMKNNLTPYEEWQQKNYGNILPDAAANCTAEELQEAGIEELERLAEWIEYMNELDLIERE